ncbi:uncharacterized protein I206_105936 [Kwoniella pini CBS 10737]|uniref:Uncharacterized protein n=1 Tax=Kwoniella pini CBS 10737 TaxID=1296096 RepID=A0AAJ8MSP5_9TREE
MSRHTLNLLENQLSTIKHELELATFLNKGILQTNTEYKLRIAELENENLILSKAESKLSTIEDELEETKKSFNKLLNEKNDLIIQNDNLIKGLNNLNENKIEWEEKYFKLIGKVESLLSNENDDINDIDIHSQNKITPINKSITNIISTSTAISAQKRTNKSINPQINNNNYNEQAQTLASSSKLSLSPVRPPTRSQSKKRRRVEDSLSIDEPEDEQIIEQDEPERNENISSKSNQLYKTPPRTFTPKSKQQSLSSNSNKKRSNVITTTSKKRDSSNKQSKLEFKVKDEPISPEFGRGVSMNNSRKKIESDSDDDPLAML